MLIHLVTSAYLSFIILVGNFLIIGLVVLCVYSAGRLHGFIAMSLGFMGIILTGGLFAFFLTLAQIHSVSIEMRIELKSHGFSHPKSVVGTVVKSLPDTKFWMGSELYYCDRVLVLTIANTIAVQSINFLVRNPVYS